MKKEIENAFFSQREMRITTDSSVLLAQKEKRVVNTRFRFNVITARNDNCNLAYDFLNTLFSTCCVINSFSSNTSTFVATW